MKDCKPELDKTGNGVCSIEILTATSGEDMPCVRLWSRTFPKGKVSWYIENSLTTLSC